MTSTDAPLATVSAPEPRTNGHQKQQEDTSTDAPTDTPTVVQRAQDALAAYIDDQGVSQASAARGIGRGKSTISQFLSGSYSGDNEAVARDVLSFIEREYERSVRPSIQGRTVVQTVAYKRIHSVTRLTHEERDVGVIIGDAGLGKTFALSAYAAEHERSAWHLEVGPEHTTKGLARSLHTRSGGTGRGTIYQLMHDVYDALRGTDTLVIIDQAEILPTRGLELCRRLHDVAGVGVVLAGMPKLLANLQGSRGQLLQLYSRVGFKARVSPATDADLRKLVDALVPRCTDVEAVAEAVAQVTRNTRIACKLLKRSGHVAEMNDLSAVSPSVVQKAKQMLVIPDPRA